MLVCNEQSLKLLDRYQKLFYQWKLTFLERHLRRQNRGKQLVSDKYYDHDHNFNFSVNHTVYFNIFYVQTDLYIWKINTRVLGIWLPLAQMVWLFGKKRVRFLFGTNFFVHFDKNWKDKLDGLTELDPIFFSIRFKKEFLLPSYREGNYPTFQVQGPGSIPCK